MNYYDIDIKLQEVPGEISICFSICGCPIKCKGCHSPYLFNKESGQKLKEDFYLSILNKYKSYATCVLFMGGEWEMTELIDKLKTAKVLGYRTCLYTGMETVDLKIMKQLNWIKTGPWNPKLGGLDKTSSNQKFKEVKTGRELNFMFHKK